MGNDELRQGVPHPIEGIDGEGGVTVEEGLHDIDAVPRGEVGSRSGAQRYIWDVHCPSEGGGSGSGDPFGKWLKKLFG